MAQQSFIDRCYRDKQGNIVIGQKPNIWVYLWLVFAVLSIIVPRGTAQQIYWYLSAGALIIWSGLELFKGVNYLRRLTGLIFLAIAVIMLLNIGR